MPEHYFTHQPSAPSKAGEVEFLYREKALRFLTDAGTFSKGRVDPGSALLLGAVGALRGVCADIGCGWGAIGLSLAAANPGARLVLTDVNERAAALAAENARRNGLANVEVAVCDGLTGMGAALDAAVTNPPVRAGKAVLDAFFRQAHERLKPGGALWVVLRVKQGAPSAKRRLAELFGNCETVARGGGYHVLYCVKGDA